MAVVKYRTISNNIRFRPPTFSSLQTCLGKLSVSVILRHFGKSRPESDLIDIHTDLYSNLFQCTGKPRALTEAEIEDFVDRWAFAAEVLYKAGADGAQLREFLLPTSPRDSSMNATDVDFNDRPRFESQTVHMDISSLNSFLLVLTSERINLEVV